MTAKKLKVGDEDTLTTIDTNADGKPDVYVLQDNAPQAAPQSVSPYAGIVIERGKGSMPDPDLPLNARSSWDKGADSGPFAVSPTNPAPGGAAFDPNQALGASSLLGEE